MRDFVKFEDRGLGLCAVFRDAHGILVAHIESSLRNRIANLEKGGWTVEDCERTALVELTRRNKTLRDLP